MNAQKRERILALYHYRNSKHPIYMWADHLFMGVILAYYMFGFIFLTGGSPNYGWFFGVGFVATMFEIARSKTELKWVEEWKSEGL